MKTRKGFSRRQVILGAASAGARAHGRARQGGLPCRRDIQEVAIVIVDHHLDLALSLSDRIVALERGQVQWTGESRALRNDLDLRRKVLWL